MAIHFVYMTTGSREEARTIGKILVESKLAACVNIIEGMHSIYVWEGKTQEDEEVVVIAKTQGALVPELTDRVKSLHSYDCPCIVSLPADGGNDAFLEWIRKTVKEPSS